MANSPTSSRNVWPQRAALVLSALSVVCAMYLWARADRQEKRAAELTLRLDAQAKEMAELREKVSSAARFGTVMQAAMGLGASSPQPGPPGPAAPGAMTNTLPVPPVPAAPPEVITKFLADAKISQSQWRAVQDVNVGARTDLLAAAGELEKASPEEANAKLDAIEGRRVRDQKGILGAQQMSAYERFRTEQGGSYAQIVCAGGAVRRVVPIY